MLTQATIIKILCTSDLRLDGCMITDIGDFSQMLFFVCCLFLSLVEVICVFDSYYEMLVFGLNVAKKYI